MLELAPMWQADAQQCNFRTLLEAMSRPGRVQPLHGLERDDSATLAVLATLLDGSVGFSDVHGLLADHQLRLLQAPLVAPEQADYVLCDGRRPPGFQPKLGTLPSPELSATLVVRVDSLQHGDQRWRLRGPGIEDSVDCRLAELHPQWTALREDWVCAFPLGADLLLVDDMRVMGLPRTTRLEVA